MVRQSVADVAERHATFELEGIETLFREWLARLPHPFAPVRLDARGVRREGSDMHLTDPGPPLTDERHIDHPVDQALSMRGDASVFFRDR